MTHDTQKRKYAYIFNFLPTRWLNHSNHAGMLKRDNFALTLPAQDVVHTSRPIILSTWAFNIGYNGHFFRELVSAKREPVQSSE